MQERSVAEPQLSLRFLGVGNARASELGSASAVLEFADEPGLLIDCGPRTLDDFRANYERELPPAVFISHLHLDHIGGIEQLFYRAYFTQRGAIKLFVPADLVAALHAKLANAPFILSEGGANFWDAFRLIPVGDWFWYEGLLFQVFPVRHSGHRAAFGVAIPGPFWKWCKSLRPAAKPCSTIAGCTPRPRTPACRTSCGNIRRRFAPGWWPITTNLKTPARPLRPPACAWHDRASGFH